MYGTADNIGRCLPALSSDGSAEWVVLPTFPSVEFTVSSKLAQAMKSWKLHKLGPYVCRILVVIFYLYMYKPWQQNIYIFNFIPFSVRRKISRSGIYSGSSAVGEFPPSAFTQWCGRNMLLSAICAVRIVTQHFYVTILEACWSSISLQLNTPIKSWFIFPGLWLTKENLGRLKNGQQSVDGEAKSKVCVYLSISFLGRGALCATC